MHKYSLMFLPKFSRLFLSTSASALVSEILMSVLQTVQKTTIYIWTVHIYSVSVMLRIKYELTKLL